MRVVVAAIVLAIAFALPSTLQGQGDTPDDVYAAVDRAYAQVEQMLADLKSGATDTQLWSDASTALVHLLTVESQLKTLDASLWERIREQAITLEEQAQVGDKQGMEVTASDLLKEVAHLRNVVATWQQKGASLTIADYGVNADDTITVPVVLEQMPSSVVDRFEIGLRFDPEVVQATEARVPQGRAESTIDNLTGRVLVKAYDIGLAPGTTPPPTILNVSLQVRGKERDVCILSFERAALFDEKNEQIPTTAANGSVRILASNGSVTPSQKTNINWGVIAGVSAAGLLLAASLIMLGIRILFSKR